MPFIADLSWFTLFFYSENENAIIYVCVLKDVLQSVTNDQKDQRSDFYSFQIERDEKRTIPLYVPVRGRVHHRTDQTTEQSVKVQRHPMLRLTCS